MFSDAKEMFSWFSDETKFFLPQDFFSWLKNFFPRNNEKCFVIKKTFSLHQKSFCVEKFIAYYNSFRVSFELETS